MLTLRFTRLSPTHHRLDIVRADGTSESAELETRSFLFHDLLHFTVESHASLAHSFFGSLAAGKSYAELAAKDASLAGELLTTERIVGPMTSFVQGKMDASALRIGLANMYEALGEPVPGFVTDTFIAAVAGQTRALMGQWKATPFGQTMELKFHI
jgi:hypothetical protein